MLNYRWLLLAAGSLALIASIGTVALAEYAETGRCYRTGTILTAEELRERVIRSLINEELTMAERENTDRKYVQVFLISRSLALHDVVGAVVSKSIVNLPKEAVFSIETESDIVKVSSEFLRGDFSIIQYGGGLVHITPSKSIEAVNRETMIERLQKERTKGYQLTFFDRVRGYGQHFIQVKAFNFIDLGCCEDRYAQNPKGGWSQASHAREIVKRFTDTRDRARRAQLVSNCGDTTYPRH